jgi:hypothetical protein
MSSNIFFDLIFNQFFFDIIIFQNSLKNSASHLDQEERLCNLLQLYHKYNSMGINFLDNVS